MRRLCNGTQAAAMPARAAAVGTPGYGTDGNPGTGPLGSIFGADEYNLLQEEMCGVVEALGLALDNTGVSFDQLRKALRRLAGGNRTSFTASATLTADHAGLVQVSAAAGNVTLTLPDAAAAGAHPIRFEVVRTDTSANTLTLAAGSGDTVEGGASVAVAPKERVTLTSDGSDTWHLVAGAIVGASGQSLVTNGYWQHPGGLVLQWGTGTQSLGVNTNIAFPIPFPTACLNVQLTDFRNDGGGYTCQITDRFGAAVTHASNDAITPDKGFYWQAIGH